MQSSFFNLKPAVVEPPRGASIVNQPVGDSLWAWLAAAAVAASLQLPVRVSADDARPPPRGLHRPVHLLTVLIGGFESDPTPEQIAGTARRSEGNSGLFRLAGDIACERVIAEYFNWNGAPAGRLKMKDPPRSGGIADVIRRHLQAFPGDRVAIVGNSWGGQTALEVVGALGAGEAPLAVQLVVFLDASSTGRGAARPKLLPVNVHRAVNYYTHNVFVWRKWEAGRRLENIDLGDATLSFMGAGDPDYSAPFDVRAHAAAEWDEDIHDDIRRRLRQLLPPREREAQCAPTFNP